MDPNPIPPSSIQPQPITPTPPSAPVAPAKSKSWLLISLVILVVLLSLGTAGFLAYKYVQLKQQVSQIKTTPILSPSPTVNLSRDEVPRDWKTYTNSKYNFSFRYPSSWVLKEVSASGMDDQIWLAAHDYSLPQGTYGGVGNGGRAPISFIISHNDLTVLGWAPEQWSDLTTSPYQIGTLRGVKKSGVSIEGLNRETVISAKIGNWYINIIPLEVDEKLSLDQILSTFKFTQAITPTPTQSSIPSKALYYSVPTGWKTVQDSTDTFAISFDPVTSKVDANTSNGLFLLRQRPEPALSYYGCESVNLYPYDGGSRHLFINKYLGETPTKSELFSDYKETEYLYNGKSCLVLNGISISQFNSVWGMCDTGSGKAFLFTSCDRDSANYEKVLQTIQLVK